MKSVNRWKIAIVTCASVPLLAAPALAAGGKSLGKSSGVVPATVQEIPGSKIKQVTITDRAAERIDLKTAKVEAKLVNGSSRSVVPYASIIYDPHGGTWVYVMPTTRTFVRTAIDVHRIEGDDVFLNSGPSVGTSVATLGVAEIYGAEFSLGH